MLWYVGQYTIVATLSGEAGEGEGRGEEWLEGGERKRMKGSRLL